MLLIDLSAGLSDGTVESREHGDLTKEAEGLKIFYEGKDYLINAEEWTDDAAKVSL